MTTFDPITTDPRAAVPAPRSPSDDVLGLLAGPTGRVVRPRDEYWDVARAAWVVSVDQRPSAVLEVSSLEDVKVAVRRAAEAGLRVVPQGTGHGAAAVHDLTGCVLLRTRGLDQVHVHADTEIACVGAGAEWAAVSAAAWAHGLTALAGSSPDVGVAGYLLGGGISWLARRFGLAVNDVVAMQVVTADGQDRWIDQESGADLFWALRGGGTMAVVTAFQLRLHRVEALASGTLFWPVERAGEVLHAWRRWTSTLPTRTMTCGRLLQLPPMPELPEPLRGRAFVSVEVAHIGELDELDRLLAPLRALGPELDTVAACTPPELARLHMDPEGPTPAWGDGMLIADLSPEAVDALVAAAGAGSGSPLLSVELRHLGGATAVAPAGAGAVGSFDAPFVCFSVGITPDPSTAAKVVGHVDVVQNALRPWTAQRHYANFVERHGGRERFHDEATLARLRRMRAAYDPRGMFAGSHPHD